MDKEKLMLEDVESEFFDSEISKEVLLKRKLKVARVLEQAERALKKAEAAGQTDLAAQLKAKISELTDLLAALHNPKSGWSSGGSSSGGEAEAEKAKKGKDGDDEDKEDEKTTTGEEDSEEDGIETDEDGTGGKDEKGKPERPVDPSAPEEPKPGKPEEPEDPDEPDGDTDFPGEDDREDFGGDSEAGGEKSKGGKSKGTATGGGGGLGDDGDGDDDGDDDDDDDDDDDGDPSTPKIKDKKILQNPFDRRPGRASKLPKELEDKIKKGDLEIEELLDAAKRILSKLDGESRKGAIQAIKDLLSNRGIFVESLLESAGGRLASMSENDLNQLLNDTMDIVNQVMDVEFSDDLPDRVAEIRGDISNPVKKAELEKEDSEHVKADHDAIRANEKENDKYKIKKGYFKGIAGMDAFKKGLFRAIADQVAEHDEEVDSWSALDRRHEDDPSIIVKGRKLDDIEDNIPTINVYFDQSGSWSTHDIEIGKNAIANINEFHNRGEIKLNIFYISAAGVCETPAEARAHGGAEGWYATLQHIKGTKVKNVIVVSDDDLDSFEWSNRPTGDNGRTYVPGCVWWLWKNADRSKKATKELIGRRGNFEYHFKT